MDVTFFLHHTYMSTDSKRYRIDFQYFFEYINVG